MGLMETVATKIVPSKRHRARAAKLAKQNSQAIHERNKQRIVADHERFDEFDERARQSPVITRDLDD